MTATPVGDNPVGNPISQPGLNSLVPAGEPFTVTWEPTTDGTVTLVLLKGPSENAVPQYAIVERIENDGEYVWTPSTDLEPSPEGIAQGYGIQLIDDATGQYQYTTQFGISNADYQEPSDAPTGYGDEIPQGYGTPASSKEVVPSPYPTVAPPKANGTEAYHPKPTGYYPAHNGTNATRVAPTGKYIRTGKMAGLLLTICAGYKPTTIQTSVGQTAPAGPSATFEPPQSTGAASSIAMSVAGLVAAAGVAVFAA